MPRPENRALYNRYAALAAREQGVTFVGRLARYQYLNMDQVVAQALSAFVATFSARACMPRTARLRLDGGLQRRGVRRARRSRARSAQDWPADRLEVVVCDDGSTDGTAAVVSGFVRRAIRGACG